ncbi:uncharacterized protein DS421_6g193510 [Arachis hypogaea]|nr:uncharacterized protein DS421_6g193510 [Arachis hypogaea]
MQQPSGTAIAAMQRSTDKAIRTRSTCRCVSFTACSKLGSFGSFYALLVDHLNPEINSMCSYITLSSVCYNCPLEPENQVGEESSPRETEPEPPLNVPPEEQQQSCQEAPVAQQLEEETQSDFAARPSLWEHDAPSFDHGISLPTSQPIPPTSQPTVTQLEILA